MAVDDPRVIWNIIGEPPESPWGYAARTGISEDEVPHSVKQAWRTWNTREQALVEKAAESMSGQSADEILGSLGYRDAADQGKSMFARYKSGEKANVLETIAGDAFQKAVGAGHMTWDPARQKYINVGLGTNENPSQIWSKEGRLEQGQSSGWGNMLTGKPIYTGAPAKGFGGTATAAGGMNVPVTPQTPAQTGPQRGQAGYRPLLRTDPNNQNFGSWGSAYNRQLKQGSAASRSNTSQYLSGMGNTGY